MATLNKDRIPTKIQMDITIHDNNQKRKETSIHGSNSTILNHSYPSSDPIILQPPTLDLKQSIEETPEQVTHPTSYADTLLHIFRGNIGSGLLAMGDAYRNAGLIFAPIMTVILGVLSVHAQHLLLNCSEQMHKKVKMDRPPDFAETVELCFATGSNKLKNMAKTMKFLVNSFLCITQLGFCCVYIVFIATNVKKIGDHYGFHLELSIHMIIVLIPILLACLVRNLKYLTPFSTIANILMAVGIAIVIYEATQDLPPLTSRRYIADWRQLPLFFGTTIYAFEGIGLVLPLKSVMKNPSGFQKPCGVLNFGMTIVGCIFVVVGFLGYLKWGDEVQGSLTLNLPPNQLKSHIVQILIAVAILFTYPLQFYVPVEIMWPSILNRFPALKSPVVGELVFRSLLVFLTFVLAESIPQLGLFISLVGAISSTALALVFPPVIDIAFKSQEPKGISTFNLLKNVVIILLGVFIFVTGTYESISSIITAFGKS